MQQGPSNGMSAGGGASMHSNYGQYGMGNGYGSQQPTYMSRDSMAANGYNGGHYGQNYMSRAPVMGE